MTLSQYRYFWRFKNHDATPSEETRYCILTETESSHKDFIDRIISQYDVDLVFFYREYVCDINSEKMFSRSDVLYGLKEQNINKEVNEDETFRGSTD